MTMQKNIKYLISGIILILWATVSIKSVQAQNAADLRFNEILVINEANYLDDFGEHNSWIEIFNSAYNSVNIGGCYLTDDLNNPTKYWIPTGDPATKIASRCYVVFWADDKTTRGIFHLNFDLQNAKIIALFDANGKTLIDKVEIPKDQRADVTYGIPGSGNTQWEYLKHSTPGANNDYSRKASAGENFIKMDPWGIGMTMIAMFVVFLALAVLYIIYKNIGLFFVRRARTIRYKQAKQSRALKSSDKHEDDDVEISGEVNAAIAMALYMYQSDMHDMENTILTIQKVSRTYSPWSSKIYTLRKTPR